MVKLTDAFLLIAAIIPFALCSHLHFDNDIDKSLVAYGNKEYYIEPETKVNWFGALHSCRRRNMELASILSIDEHEFLVDYIKKKGDPEYYWIAGNNLEFNDTDNFYWANSGNRMDFATWSANNPDNYQGHENCVHIFYEPNGAWNDNRCSAKMLFICQKRSSC